MEDESVPMCSSCNHRHYESMICHCGHMPRPRLFPDITDLPLVNKLQMFVFNILMQSGAIAEGFLRESSIIRRRVLVEELGWLPSPASGHEMDNFERASGHVLAQVGDWPVGCCRWRIVSPPPPSAYIQADGTVVNVAGGSLSHVDVYAPAQPCIDRLVVTKEYRGSGIGLRLLMQCLADIIYAAGEGIRPDLLAAGQIPLPTARALSMSQEGGLPPQAAAPGAWTQVRYYCPGFYHRGRAWLERQGFRASGRLYSTDPTGGTQIDLNMATGWRPALIADPRYALDTWFVEYTLPIALPDVHAAVHAVLQDFSTSFDAGVRVACGYDRLMRDGEQACERETTKRRPDPASDAEIKAEIDAALAGKTRTKTDSRAVTRQVQAITKALKSLAAQAAAWRKDAGAEALAGRNVVAVLAGQRCAPQQ